MGSGFLKIYQSLDFVDRYGNYFLVCVMNITNPNPLMRFLLWFFLLFLYLLLLLGDPELVFEFVVCNPPKKEEISRQILYLNSSRFFCH